MRKVTLTTSSAYRSCKNNRMIVALEKLTNVNLKRMLHSFAFRNLIAWFRFFPFTLNVKCLEPYNKKVTSFSSEKCFKVLIIANTPFKRSNLRSEHSFLRTSYQSVVFGSKLKKYTSFSFYPWILSLKLCLNLCSLKRLKLNFKFDSSFRPDIKCLA